MKQLSQLPDEFTVDTSFARLSYKPTFPSYPEMSQHLPKQPKIATPMSFSIKVQEYFAQQEEGKKPMKFNLKRKTLVEPRTQPKQQVKVIMKEEFKYCRKSLQLSVPQYKQETTEDRIHGYSIKSKQQTLAKISNQLEQISENKTKVDENQGLFFQRFKQGMVVNQLEQIHEDQTEVDEEQEQFFQRQRSKFHYYLNKAKNIKYSIEYVQTTRWFGTLEMCLGLENGNEVTYFRRNNEIVAKIN